MIIARKFGWLNLKWHLYLSECHNEIKIQGKCCVLHVVRKEIVRPSLKRMLNSCEVIIRRWNIMPYCVILEINNSFA